MWGKLSAPCSEKAAPANLELVFGMRIDRPRPEPVNAQILGVLRGLVVL
jgi:hypothetical protein